MGRGPDGSAVLRALGAIAICRDDDALPIGGEKPRRLLAALILHRGTVVSTSRLIDVVWGDDAPDTGVATLQAYLSRLRRQLPRPGVELLTEAPGYRLVAADGATDIDRFEASLSRGLTAMPGAPAQALEHLDAALAEWRGDAFGEFADEPWVMPEAVRLGELRLHAEEARLTALLALGLDERAAGEAEALTLEHPWREQPWRMLLLALHRSGRQGDALRAAGAYRARLRDDLGLDPSLEFVAVEQQIAVDASPRRTAPAASPVAIRHVEDTALIGREEDVALVAELVEQRRLATLLGPGGIGKTQLARAAAHRVVARTGLATAMVELAPVRTDTSVVSALATQLGVQTQQGRSVQESVLELLAAEPLLLVLDNCEHVLDTIAGFVERLLTACPAVHVLATSREPLGLPQESVYQVPTLPIAAPDACAELLLASPSVALFLQRAASANRALPDDEATIRSVAELCRRLDGVPLAIELAAARTRAFSPAEINARLGDRFDLLAGSSRVGDVRHRSLRTLVDWSYQLLDPPAQRLFQRLSTFAGSFDLDAAERVCGFDDLAGASIAALLGSLVDKSMVQALAGDRTTYRLLETLREFGAALAEPEAGDLARHHTAWLVDVCELGARGLHGPHEHMWLETFERLFDDLRLAVRNALDAQDIGSALRIVVAAREHAFRCLRYELIGWAEAALAAADPSEEPLAAAALGIVSYGRFVRGEIEESIELGRAAIALANESGSSTLGVAERTLANACFFQGDMESTSAAVNRQLAEAHAAADDARIAHAYYMASLGQTRTGNAVAGVRNAEQAMAAADRSRNPTAIAQAAYCLGIWAAAGDPAQALQWLVHSETVAAEVGNRWFELFARTETLWHQGLAGEPYPALAGFAEVLAAWHRAGDWANQWLSLRHVFGICDRIGADELAMIIHGLLLRVGATDAFPFEPGAATTLAHTVEHLRRRLGDRATALEQQGWSGSTSAVVDRIVDRLRALVAAQDRRASS